MQSVCIGVNNCAEEVIDHIKNELKNMKAEKVNYSVTKNEKLISIVYSIEDEIYFSPKPVNLFNKMKICISNALADYIIRQYEERIIKKIINSYYCYFNNIEKKEIFRLVYDIIKNDELFSDNLLKFNRKNIIFQKLVDYFQASDSIILDGFINFRLKEYMKILGTIVDRAVDEFLVEKEYQEFIKLLKYFVEIQEPKYIIVHVIFENISDSYILYDHSGNDITNECVKEYLSDIIDEEINKDDLLVSSLISFAPRRIIMHMGGVVENKEIVDTIQSIFSGKIIICNGCEFCLADNIIK